jgi:hypothetical protein
MANSLNNTTFQQFWSRRMQRKHAKEAVYRAIASFEEQTLLKQGDTVHRPYRSAIIGQTYTRGVAVTIQNLTNTDETLVVSTAEVFPFYIDDLDQLQSNFRFINEYADDAGVQLVNFIDGDVLAEYANAGSIIDDSVINPGTGVSGNGITVDTSNIQRVFSSAKARMRRKNVTKNGMFAVVSPDGEQVLTDYLAGKNSNLGDSTSLNGHIGHYYGFDLYCSNNLTWTGTITIATEPNDGDTVTFKTYDIYGNVQTITFTFKTTLGSTAGNVLIGGSASAANTNLAALLNAPSVTTAQGVALSSTSLGYLFYGLQFTATAAATSVAVVAPGQSFVQVSQNLTASTTDGWVAAKQICHWLFGVKGATDVVIQARPTTEIKDVPTMIGKNILPWILYGKKTFTEGKAKLVDVQVRTDSYVM